MLKFAPWLHESEKSYGIKLDMGWADIVVLFRKVWTRKEQEVEYDQALAKTVDWGAPDQDQEEEEERNVPEDLPRSGGKNKRPAADDKNDPKAKKKARRIIEKEYWAKRDGGVQFDH